MNIIRAFLTYSYREGLVYRVTIKIQQNTNAASALGFAKRGIFHLTNCSFDGKCRRNCIKDQTGLLQKFTSKIHASSSQPHYFPLITGSACHVRLRASPAKTKNTWGAIGLSPSAVTTWKVLRTKSGIHSFPVFTTSNQRQLCQTLEDHCCYSTDSNDFARKAADTFPLCLFSFSCTYTLPAYFPRIKFPYLHSKIVERCKAPIVSFIYILLACTH